MDPLADALTNIKNCEMLGKKECEVKPASKLIGDVLKIMQKQGYIGNFEFIDDGKSGIYRIQLLGKINNCNVIKPRYSVQYKEFIFWEKKYLPAAGFGVIIVSTPRGVIDHNEAKQSHIGGKLLAFVY